MKFIFRQNWGRTLLSIAALAGGSLVTYRLMTGFDKTPSTTAGFTLIICVLWTIAGKNLWELYGGFEGNWEKYRLERSISKATILDSEAKKTGFDRKKTAKFSIFVLAKSQEEIARVGIFASGKKKITGYHKYRLQKLTNLLRFWIKNQRQKEKTSTPGIQRRLIGETAYTYAVDSITATSLKLSRVEALNTIVDQKLPGRKLMQGTTEICTVGIGSDLKDDRLVIQLPQSGNYIAGLYMDILFVTADNILVPNELIERRFLAHYIGNRNAQLLDFCKEQIEVHLQYRPTSEINVLGIYLDAEDLGAPTIACCVEMRQTYEELVKVLTKTNNTASYCEAEAAADYLRKLPLNAREASMFYLVHKKEEKVCKSWELS